MQDTLLSDIDGSIFWWYFFYFLSNAILVICSLIVIVLPTLTGADVVDKKWGFLAAACGAALAYLGLGGVSDNFIKARNDLQIAKYQYYTDKDRDKLIAAYKRDKERASYVPAIPPLTTPEPAGAQPPQKNP